MARQHPDPQAPSHDPLTVQRRGGLSGSPVWSVFTFMAALLMIVVGISTTHRIAGPIYRIESEIDRVLAGEKGVRVRLRRHDSFPDLAIKVNQLIERIDGSRKG